MIAVLQRNLWPLGLAVLLLLLLGLTRAIQPTFGTSGLESLARAALPYAFATAAMVVVVLVGGIDLSVGAMMAVASVTAAFLMTQIGWVPAVAITLAVGVLMGAVNGTLIVLTRVPDIVVTLAMLFVWEGTALLIMDAPGGTADRALTGLVRGWTGPVPSALVVLAVCLAVVWLPLRRSRLGLSIYATGSDHEAAFRSGVAVGPTRIAAYAICGLYCGMGGISLVMLTGIGEPVPGPYLLASVAAVVLGGVVLGGGRGGMLAPIVAVFVLRIIRTILTLMGVDPNVTTIVEGAIMVAVVMLGGVILMRGARA
jgi:ribose transport system permease protein